MIVSLYISISRVILYTAVPHCSHSRAPIVHTAVPWENNKQGCVYLRCRAVCKLPGCVEGHPWFKTPVMMFTASLHLLGKKSIDDMSTGTARVTGYSGLQKHEHDHLTEFQFCIL